MILTIVKVLLNMNSGDTSKDELLTTLINIINRKVLNYCNLLALPEELEYTVAEMVVALFKSGYGVSTTVQVDQTSTVTPGLPTGKIKKEAIGDYSVEYDTSSSSSTNSVTPETVIYDYTAQLNKFRKLRL